MKEAPSFEINMKKLLKELKILEEFG